MKKYDLIVIISAYNSEVTLNKCIDSVLNQTQKNIEITVKEYMNISKN